MTKGNLLNLLATHGYNVGFGAKKNFASFDIVSKLPSWIGALTLMIGIIQLGFDSWGQNKLLSTVLILVSVSALYVNIFTAKNRAFEDEGIRCTKLFNELRDLYFFTKGQTKTDFTEEVQQMNSIMERFYSSNVTQQVFMSQWFAHFKFFYEMQIDWVDEQLQFKFFKDKFPNSLKAFLLLLACIIITVIIYEYF